MARKTFTGPNGAVVTLEVPSAAMDQKTWDAKIASGEYVEVKREKPASKKASKHAEEIEQDDWEV